jgi:MFS family permease
MKLTLAAAERGGFFGVSGTGTLLGTAIGPVIGGGLAQGLGWRLVKIESRINGINHLCQINILVPLHCVHFCIHRHLPVRAVFFEHLLLVHMVTDFFRKRYALW